MGNDIFAIYWQCERKIKHANEEHADKALNSLRYRDKKRNNGLIAHKYKCRFCDGWHIGSNNEQKDYGQ